MEELTAAIREGNFGKARKLVLKRGADVNYIDTWNDTPLELAAYSGDIEMTEFLIEHGADVNQLDGAGWPVLMSMFSHIIDDMAQNGAPVPRKEWMEMMDFLVLNGADIDVRNKDGESLADQFKMVGADISSYNKFVEWFEAVIPGLYERIIHRREELDDFRYYYRDQHLTGDDITDVGDRKTDKFHKAVYNGDAKLVQAMIDDGIDLHRRSHRGKYAVEIVNLTADYDMLQLLLNNGLDVTKQYDGTTALHLTWGASFHASKSYYSPYDFRDALVRMTGLLVSKGADMLCADASGFRPIDLFERFCRPEVSDYRSSIQIYSETVSTYQKVIPGLLDILTYRKNELVAYRAQKHK